MCVCHGVGSSILPRLLTIEIALPPYYVAVLLVSGPCARTARHVAVGQCRVCRLSLGGSLGACRCSRSRLQSFRVRVKLQASRVNTCWARSEIRECVVCRVGFCWCTVGFCMVAVPCGLACVLATVVRVCHCVGSSGRARRVTAVLSDGVLVFPPSRPVSAGGQWFSAAAVSIYQHRS